MDDTTKKIIRSLAKNQQRNRIINDLSEFSGLEWDEAERLVDQIDKKHGTEIYSRQRPFYILIGILLAMGGILMSAYIFFSSLNGLIINLAELSIPYLGNAIIFVIGLLAFWRGLRKVLKIVQR